MSINSLIEHFHGLSLIGKSGCICARISTGGQSKSIYTPLNGVGALQLRMEDLARVNSRVKPVLLKLMELETFVDPNVQFSERLWILQSALVIMKYYVSAFRDCDIPIKLGFRNLDFAFGLTKITSLETFKGVIKSSLVWPASCLLGGDATKIVIPFRGHARSYLKQILRTRVSEKKLSLVQTLLIGVKKTAVAMPQSQVRSSQDECVQRTQLEPRQTKSAVTAVCRVIHDSVLRGFTYDCPEEVASFSLRSNLESTRSDGGSYGFAAKVFGVTPKTTVVEGGSMDEVGLHPIPIDIYLSALGYHAVPEFNYQLPRWEAGTPWEDNMICIEGALVLYSVYYVPTRYASQYDFLRDSAITWARNKVESGLNLMEEYSKTPYGLDSSRPYDMPAPRTQMGLKREVVGLCEPLKVRCITLSHWWESPLWADLQRSLQRFLQRKPYVASGKALPVEYFDSLASTLAEIRRRDPGTVYKIISDDGDAATDSISLMLSHLSIYPFIPKELRNLYTECCGATGSAGIASRVPKEDPEYVQQKNSQFMGDRLSFVKLTAIHSGYKLAFLKRYQHVYGWTDREIEHMFLVNGDDGVILLPEPLVDDYFTWMGSLWNLNRMKTQKSTQVFTINSRMFRLDHSGMKFTEVKFMRYNILERREKSGDRMINPQVWNVFEATAPSHIPGDILFREFHRNWSGTLAFLTKGKGNNYFLPEIMGGLGLVPRAGQTWYTNSRQRYAVQQTLKRVGKTLPPPIWRTAVVPRQSDVVPVERTVRSNINQGVRVGDRNPFVGTGAVKRITESTKLYTRKLPRGNAVDFSIPEEMGFCALSYGELTVRPELSVRMMRGLAGRFVLQLKDLLDWADTQDCN